MFKILRLAAKNAKVAKLYAEIRGVSRHAMGLRRGGLAVRNRMVFER